MGNNAYLAEEAMLKNEAHIHHWAKCVFASWDTAFLGLMCKECNKFIAEEDVAAYVNELEKKLKNVSQSV